MCLFFQGPVGHIPSQLPWVVANLNEHRDIPYNRIRVHLPDSVAHSPPKSGGQASGSGAGRGGPASGSSIAAGGPASGSGSLPQLVAHPSLVAVLLLLPQIIVYLLIDRKITNCFET